MATRQEVVKELEFAGMSESDLATVDADYWIDKIVQYRKTGRCGSVMFSTVEFIPVMSKLLEACSKGAA
jgi:hypothetical protein